MGVKNKRLVESVLFSATKPISINEIKDATGLGRKKIKETLEELIDDYNVKRKNDTSIKIVKAGNKYTMQIKNRYADKSTMVADPEIDSNLLKTLTLIAFHQPIKQSNLRRMIGDKAYDHVDELAGLKLVHRTKHRNTLMLRTTKKFPEYFGIDSTKPEEIRAFLMKQASDKIKNNI